MDLRGAKSMPLGELIEKFFGLQEEMQEIKRKKSDLQKDIDYVEALIIEKMEEAGIEKTATDSGTVSLKAEMYPAVKDINSVVRWAFENNMPHLLQKRVSKTVVEELLEDTGEVPEGIELTPRTRLNRRRRT